MCTQFNVVVARSRVVLAGRRCHLRLWRAHYHPPAIANLSAKKATARKSTKKEQCPVL